jgi:hypothetical protein
MPTLMLTLVISMPTLVAKVMRIASKTRLKTSKHS